MADSEWEPSGLDLDAYLERIGYGGALDTSSATLTMLHRAHRAAIPFENLDVFLGRGVSIELADIESKLVRRRRGGYCHEHGLLFGAVLERLGFGVDRLLARVGDDPIRPPGRTHTVLAVAGQGGHWLCDVGFGAGLLEPIPLQPNVGMAQGPWTYRLVRPPHMAGALVLQERTATTDWTTLYSFTDESQHLSDIRMANHFTSTWPASKFVRHAAIVRKHEHEVRRLRDRHLTVSGPGALETVTEIGDAEYADTLHDLGVDLEPSEIEALIAALPPAGSSDDSGWRK